jgi:hypothetical protein
MIFQNGDNENSENPLSKLILKNGVGRLIGSFLFNALGINADDNVNDNSILKTIKGFINSDATNAQQLIGDVVS